MGSFNSNCITSNLSIGGGTPVRVLLVEESRLDENPEWLIGSIPLRGNYNDYGEAEGVDFGSLEAKINLDMLHQRLAYHSWGDNLHHDHPVLPESTLEEIFKATREPNRHLVKLRGVYDLRWGAKILVPKGVPTWRRVSKRLSKAGFTNLVCDRLGYGMVRVRATDTYSWDPKLASETLSDFYRTSVKNHWLLVLPLEGQLPPANPKDGRTQTKRNHILSTPHEYSRGWPSKRLVGVRKAFIREDVWQGIVNHHKDTLEKEFAKGLECLDSAVDQLQHHGSDPHMREHMRKYLGEAEFNKAMARPFDKPLKAYRAIHSDRNWYLGPHTGCTEITPNCLEPHFGYLTALYHQGQVTKEEAHRVIRGLAETFVVGLHMWDTNTEWRPSASVGHQYGDDKASLWAHKFYAELAESKLKQWARDMGEEYP